MSLYCPQCNSGQYLQKGKRLCIKCRALYLESKHIENKGKPPKIASDFLFTQYYLEHKTLREIAEITGTTSSNIRYWLIKYEIPIRSLKEANGNTFNSTIFKNLNSKSAYLLGYFYSDGDLLLNKKTGKYFLRIYSKYRDNIEKVKALLQTDAKIQFRNEKLNEKERKGALYFIHIADQEIVKDLINLGMVYDKNHSAKYPDIPEQLNRHFIRGLWAGSGSVYFEDERLLRSKFDSGSIDLITRVEQILNENGLSKRTIYRNSLSKKPSYAIRYNTDEDQHKLFQFFYKRQNKDSIEQRQYEQYKLYFT